jgi:hypothetical protein
VVRAIYKELQAFLSRGYQISKASLLDRAGGDGVLVSMHAGERTLIRHYTPIIIVSGFTWPARAR